jgi:hypothetical protein
MCWLSTSGSCVVRSTLNARTSSTMDAPLPSGAETSLGTLTVAGPSMHSESHCVRSTGSHAADVPSRRAREWSSEAAPISFAACGHTPLNDGHSPPIRSRCFAFEWHLCMPFFQARWMQAKWGTYLSEGGRGHDYHGRGVVAVLRTMALRAMQQPTPHLIRTRQLTSALVEHHARRADESERQTAVPVQHAVTTGAPLDVT